ncbi:MAG: hypothetical protein HRT35_08275 [Algicola sp.]|nr:hypothetical protein [Algicola sp.]
MTDKVLNISHAANKTGTITKSEVSAVTFPTSRKAGLPVNRSDRNSTSLKLFSAALGFQRVQLLAFLLLGLLLAGVVFLLPSMVDPAMVEDISETQAEPEKIIAPPDSPWNDAQLAKQRREAQEVLSKILDIQSKLEAKKVQLWAAESFVQAMQAAASGDEQYRQRNFSGAQNNYRSSLTQFESIQAKVDTVYRQQMNQGLKAIDDNQPKIALDSYDLALSLKPDSLDADQGFRRAEVLEEVMALVKSGKHLLKTQKLPAAKEAFEQALALDNKSAPAQQQLATTNQAITDDNFSSAMSQGYAALNQKQYSKAIKSFTTAGKIKPAAKDAQSALVQATNKDIQSNIATYLVEANSLEKQEQWRQANDFYDKMLALDSSVIKARIGAIRTKARAKLDNQLLNTLNSPQRLTSQSVYVQAQKLYQEAVKVQNPGSRLSGQTVQLNTLLNQLTLPISVKFESNNQTDVTLYKFGKLGSFSAKSMDLKPGKYTLVGSRKGYRDVRREFTVMPGEVDTTIVVQCVDKITNG